MNTTRDFENLPRRDQWWLDAGLSFGAFLKQLFHSEGTRGETVSRADAYNRV